MSDNFILPTELPGVFLIEKPSFPDERGFFWEVYNAETLKQVSGIDFKPVQSNLSHSKQGVLRGIHIAPWHKLVTVINGAAQQVVVDTRPDSPTFGKHISINLGGSEQASLFIPAGCGNAFLTLSDQVDYIYLVTDYWAHGKEKSIIYSDPDIAIDWQIKEPLLSKKDAANPTFRQVFPEKF